MVDLQLSLLICCMKGVLEVASDSLLAELFLNSVDNRHDSLDVAVENIADLQALKRNLAIVFWLAIVGEDNAQALICDIVDDGGEVLVRGDVRGARVARAHICQTRVQLG